MVSTPIKYDYDTGLPITPRSKNRYNKLRNKEDVLKQIADDYVESYMARENQYELFRDPASNKLVYRSDETYQRAIPITLDVAKAIAKAHYRDGGRKTLTPKNIEKAFEEYYLPFSIPEVLNCKYGKADLVGRSIKDNPCFSSFVQSFYVNPLCKKISGSLFADRPCLIYTETPSLFEKALNLAFSRTVNNPHAEDEDSCMVFCPAEISRLPWDWAKLERQCFFFTTRQAPCELKNVTLLQKKTNILAFQPPGSDTKVPNFWRKFSFSEGYCTNLVQYLETKSFHPLKYKKVLYWMTPALIGEVKGIADWDFVKPNTFRYLQTHSQQECTKQDLIGAKWVNRNVYSRKRKTKQNLWFSPYISYSPF